MAPEVWSVSFPMKSQPIKLMVDDGKLISATNFWFNLFGIDFNVSVHSRRITPPAFTQMIESIFLAISNSDRDLTQAAVLYFTSY